MGAGAEAGVRAEAGEKKTGAGQIRTGSATLVQTSILCYIFRLCASVDRG